MNEHVAYLLGKGVLTTRYSVSRAYQIKENINVIKVSFGLYAVYYSHTSKQQFGKGKTIESLANSIAFHIDVVFQSEFSYTVNRGNKQYHVIMVAC